MIDIGKIIDSLKGISGSANVLDRVINLRKEIGNLSLEPGDFVRGGDAPIATAAPISSDLWYLNSHDNFMAHYFTDANGHTTIDDVNHYNYLPYMTECLSFLSILSGLKPLRVLRDLEQLAITGGMTSIFGETILSQQYSLNGTYWINTLAFELWRKGLGMQYSSDGPPSKNINDYVGYLAFPVGQLGVMEVVSLVQETEDFSGYLFAAVSALDTYWDAPAITIADLDDGDKPSLQSTPEMFPDMKDASGGALAGQNYCYGRHLVESAYLLPSTPGYQQNEKNSEGGTAYAPTPNRDVEILSSNLVVYAEEVAPKMWMRYWIHKDSTLPVPGEFLGILCRPVACPPHVWWFQESSPFVYAGNWVETGHLTSGVITVVIPESDRTDGGIGGQYKAKVHGCEVLLEATDFFLYSVGDRVAILKVDSTAAKQTQSFTWVNQTALKSIDKGTAKTNYIIIPATFYMLIC